MNEPFERYNKAYWDCPFCGQRVRRDVSVESLLKHMGKCQIYDCDPDLKSIQKYRVIFDVDSCINCTSRVKCLAMPYAIAYNDNHIVSAFLREASEVILKNKFLCPIKHQLADYARYKEFEE